MSAKCWRRSESSRRTGEVVSGQFVTSRLLFLRLGWSARWRPCRRRSGSWSSRGSSIMWPMTSCCCRCRAWRARWSRRGTWWQRRSGFSTPFHLMKILRTFRKTKCVLKSLLFCACQEKAVTVAARLHVSVQRLWFQTEEWGKKHTRTPVPSLALLF